MLTKLQSFYQNQIKASLTRKTLLNMALRVTCVVLASVLLSYFHVMSNLSVQTQGELEKYIIERGQRESSIFQLAEDNLIFLKKRLLQELKQDINPKTQKEFEHSLFRWDDKTIRNFPQNQSIYKFDTFRYPSIFIGKNVTLSVELKHRMYVAYELIKSYAPAWSNRFDDTYFNTPENTNVTYYKGRPLGLRISPDLYIPNEEFYYVADPSHDPTRKPTWTGLYFDKSIKVWMVSIIVPIYSQNNSFIGSLGHDIILNDLMSHTINDKLPGTYNLIFNKDGRLIAHPKFMKEITQANGLLTIPGLNNPELNHIFQVIQANNINVGVLENPQDNEYLAIAKIKGPDWYFVNVYPKSLLSKFAFDSVKFILISGLISLLLEIYLLSDVLRKQITNPLHELINVINKIYQGDFQVSIQTNRADEIGQIAASFNRMTMQLNSSFRDLEKSNTELENRVLERTIELEGALKNLQQAQAKMLQSEKMSALGQMIAGIAHEINNPVNFIDGNLTYIEDYTQDLLKLINSYQKHYPDPPISLQSEIDSLELEFIVEDLARILKSMEIGTNRITEIVKSLRSFSRLDEADFKAVDIHEGIDNTLLILQHRLTQNQTKLKIEVIKEYGELPLIECYSRALNQVFMNILNNAIDALEAKGKQDLPATITISTTITEHNWLKICIADNGIGINEDIRTKIFDPFFTTKDVGKGTGLGLSISYQIIVEKHNGKIECDCQAGYGTKFMIEIPMENHLHKNL